MNTYVHPRNPKGRIIVGEMSMDYDIVTRVGSWPSNFRVSVHVDPEIKDQFFAVLSAFESPVIIGVTLDVDSLYLGDEGVTHYLEHQEKSMRYALDDLAKANGRAIVSVSPLDQEAGALAHTRKLRMRALTVPVLAWTEWSR